MRRKHVKRVYLRKQQSNQALVGRNVSPPTHRRRSVTQQLPVLRENVPTTTQPQDSQHTARLRGVLMFPDAPTRKIGSSKHLRSLLRTLAGANAVISWVVSILGYQVVKDSSPHDGYKIAICVLSLLQICLVIWYCSTSISFLERLRLDLRLSPSPVPPLCHSPALLGLCLLECAFHLVVPPVQELFAWHLYMLGTEATLTLDDLCYVLLLLRNYHSVRLLFWCSPLSTKRAYLFTKAVDVPFTSQFVVRAYLATYSLRLIFGVYLAIAILSGITVYVFEKAVAHSEFYSIANGVWLVAYTQTTEGYGEITPKTYFGCIAVLFSCFIGVFLLSLVVVQSSRIMSMSMAEASLYSQVVYSNRKRTFTKNAVVFIQKWWRLMHMRLHHSLDATVIVDFYSGQGKYLKVIQTCQRVKDRRFEWQIQAFQTHVEKECRRMTEYLQPVLIAEALVLTTQTTDILRAQYSIKMKTQDISREMRKYRAKAHQGSSISPIPNSRPTSGRIVSKHTYASSALSENKEMAIAKAKAHQKLIGRLIRDDTATPVCSETSTFRPDTTLTMC